MSNSIAVPFEILRTISQGNQSGCFVISDPKDNSVSWKLYVNGDYVSYGTSIVGQRERLNCLWQQFNSDQKVLPLDLGGSEYEELYQWWLSEKLPIPDLQQFLFNLSQETLSQVLSFGQTSIEFFPNDHLAEPLMRHPWQDLLDQSQMLIQEWQRVRLYLPSPFSRLHLDSQNMYGFYQFWKGLNKKPETFQEENGKNISLWLQLLSQKHCLYEITTQIGIAPLSLVEFLLPLLKAKIIQILPFQQKEHSLSFSLRGGNNTQPVQLSRTPRTETAMKTAAVVPETAQNLPRQKARMMQPIVACIDDSKTVQRQVQMTLEAAGYQVLSITEPASTLTVLVRQKPVLILLDINMPEIDGYELCRMLNRSRKLQDIPIVMLTGREGVVDRLRAKLVGAKDYLTKPFEPNQLIEVVQQLALQPLSA